MNTRHYTHRNGNATLILLVIGCLVIALGYYAYASMKTAFTQEKLASFQFREVETGMFKHTVIESGVIESSQNIDIVCNVRSKAGGVQIIWVIEEGAQVKEGDKLVELDTTTLEDSLQQQQLIMNRAKSTKISAAAAVRRATIARQEYLEGTFKQNEQLIESNILIAKQNLSTALDKVAFSERLAAKGFVTQQQLQADRFAVKRANLDMSLKENELRTLREITKQKMLVGFDADIETAKASEQAEEKNYAEEESQLTEIQQQIENCIIVAPDAGQVVYANQQSSRGGAEFIVEAGANVRERQSIIKLPDPEQMQVKAKVNEGRIAFIRKGQRVDVTVGALEGQTMQGVVLKVNKYPEAGSWFNSEVKEFATYIKILDPPDAIRTGLTAEVEMLVNTMANQTMIPVQTLHEDQEQAFCLIKRPYDINNPLHSEQLGGKHGDPGEEFSVEIVEIEYAASNNKFLAITHGLEASDMVVMNPRSEEQILNRLVAHYRGSQALSLFDTDKNGSLSPTEVATMNDRLGFEGITSFTAVDKDDNGAIDVNELGNLIERTQELLEIKVKTEIPVEEAAEEEDEDPLAEFKKQAETMVANFWPTMDANGDGKLGAEEISSSRDPASMKKADTDKDGEVSKEEFIVSMAKRLKARAESGGGGFGSGGGQQ
ncbi:MAG: HlyD family efflux transporter periplasmic adaptor subunit [Planctomycetaceae bacterium]|jgi:HlyD family secretion protein|nr:HlyD family efflux transporter periplasmic adaptor subunit [Planctomycetaceae bacterium]MBT4011261.1 HlyD family efflux transporter periplasmic adaptor subunit [Planctomycetaceae bacterium]MBT4723488.1 HlyD family efflux transporter periplasmic adaptor subunit [Planctomycetaceae bacterium]MBT4844309.1 HlyD family efflux transporter periplasmic adaptor subunit [Planctomycetaceae bacterium]MBT5125872.1 HlyD family efflux transporter periplasmic adaptor subunit [Planctomycetaceae bacterium]